MKIITKSDKLRIMHDCARIGRNLESLACGAGSVQSENIVSALVDVLYTIGGHDDAVAVQRAIWPERKTSNEN